MSINKDFQPPRSSGHSVPRKFKFGWLLVAAVVLLGGVSLFWLWNSSGSTPEACKTPAVAVAPTTSVPLSPALPVTVALPHHQEIKQIVPDGSSISALLGDYFTSQEIFDLNRQSRKVFPFTKICAGHSYQISAVDGKLDSFVYEIDPSEQLVISRDGDQIKMERRPIVYDVTTELVQGTIKSSLFEAVAEIGERPELTIMLADIFAWDVDFILDIRSGDTFQALVEKRSRDGKAAGYGHILAAEFVNQNRVFKAVRFKDGKQSPSYYNEKGENVRKAFLRAPLSFSRISSGYTMHRFHPILKSWKSHPAIDYVAPVGTPIKTVGDGTIYRIGYTRANGNFIEVRHSNGYSSIYLHMKALARGLKKGRRVSQGQVIGYLGSTGLATGPHLCFRMRHNGAPVNPARIKVPAARSVSKKNLTEFKRMADPLLARLDENRARVRVARLDAAEVSSVTGKNLK